MILNISSNATSLLVVGIFLLLTLVIGLYSGKNVKNFKEYVLGRRRFSTITLTITLLATNMGAGSFFGALQQVYSYGIIATLSTFGIIVHFLFMSYYVPKKLLKFQGSLTTGDIMEKLYGVESKIFVGILSLIYSICIAGGQLVALGSIFESLLGISNVYGILFAGITLAMYTTLGGIKSVTFTDIFQFMVLIVVLPMISFYLLNTVGGFENLFKSLKSQDVKIINHENLSFYILIFILWCIPSSLTDPPVMQRNLMASNSIQIKNSYLIRAIFVPAFRITVMLIGLCSIVLFPKINSNEASLYVIKYFQNPLSVGFIICSLLALTMSTADSYLHSSGVVATNDIIMPFLGKYSTKKFNTLIIAKVFTFLLSFLSIFLAIKIANTFKLTLFVVGFMSPLMTVPLLSGLGGVKTSKKVYWTVSVLTIIIFLISYFYLPPQHKLYSSIIGSISNIFLFFSLTFIQNKGIPIINRDYDKIKPQTLWKFSISKFVQNTINIFPTPFKIFEFSKKSVMRCGANNVLFGIFVCINFIVPYFMWDHENKSLYDLMIYLRLIGGLLGGLLILKSEWKDFLKPYFPLFWHITLLYCLPFTSTLMFLISKGSIIWLLNIGISIFFFIVLTETSVFLTMFPIGVLVGALFYILKIGTIDLSSFGFDVNYQLFYQIIFSSIIGLFFSHRKKIFHSIKSNEGTNLGLALCHELRNTGLYIYPAAQINLMYLNKYKSSIKKINNEEVYCLKKLDFEHINEQSLEIEKLGKLMKKIVGTFEKMLKEYQKSINNPQNYSMKFLIKQTLEQFIFKPGEKEKLEIDYTDDFIAKVPKQVFTFVIDNIIRNAFKHSNCTKIQICFSENELHIKDNGTGVSEIEMSEIFKMYFTTGNASSSSGIGLAFAKQIIEGFGGEIWVESEIGDDSYTDFIIKFPIASTELSNEEIEENIKNEVKKKIAINLHNNNTKEEIIKKTTGYSIEDLN